MSLTKTEARNIAVNFVSSCESVLMEALYKSYDYDSEDKNRYDGDDYDKIKKEIDYILSKVDSMSMKPKKK
jgi:hypothetical protein